MKFTQNIFILVLLLAGPATAQSFEPFQILNNPITKGARFGYSVMSMGDLDGNGVSDILVGAPGENPLNQGIGNEVTVGGLWLVLMDGPSSVGTTERYDFLDVNLPPDSLGLNIMELDEREATAPKSVYVTAKIGNSGQGNFGGANVFVRQVFNIELDGGSFSDTWLLRGLVTSVVFVGDVNTDGISDYITISKDRWSSNTAGFNDLAGELTINLPDQTGFISRHTLSLNSVFSTSPKFGIHARAIGDLDGDEIDEMAVSDDNSIWIISMGADFTIKWSREIEAESLGLPSVGSFGETFEAVDDSGSPAHLVLPLRAESGEQGSLHLLTFESDGSVRSHQEISRSQFPAGPEFDFDRHVSLSVESVDPTSSEVIFLMGLPFADVGSENAGAVHKFRLTSDLSVTHITSISNSTLQLLGLGEGFSNDPYAADPYLIGDIDGNGYDDLVSERTVHLLDSNAKIIGTKVLVPEDQLGHRVGDLNGDGIDDVVFTPTPSAGWARLAYLDGNGEVESFYDLHGTGGGLLQDLLPIGFDLGISVARIGDVDGNSVRDLAISARGLEFGDHGFVYVILLDQQGRPSSVERILFNDGQAPVNFTSGGMNLANVGDVNGDTIPDIAVGFPGNGSSGSGQRAGAVHIVFLNIDGSQKSKFINSPETGYEEIFVGTEQWGTIEGIGDLDDDGTQDLLLGPHFEAGSVTRGLKVLFMSPDGSIRSWRSLTNNEGPHVDLFSRATRAGHYPQRLWDIDGDGLDEIIVSYTEEETFKRGPIVLSLASILGAEITLPAPGLEVTHAGVDFNLQAEVRSLGGGVEISQVDANLRVAGQEQYFALQMDKGTGVNWSATIPGFLMTGQGLEYYVSASVVGRADHREPPQGVVSLPITVESGIETVVESGAEEDGYRLISVPFELANPSANSLLESSLGEYDESSWRFFRADRNTSELSRSSISVDPGSAYWMISRAQQFIDWGSGTSVPTDSVFAINLITGWSSFGLPFDFELDQSLVATRSGTIPDIRRYEGAWTVHDTTLVPFEGYAIFNPTGETDILYIAPSREVAEMSAEFDSQSAKAGGQADWSIPIHARMGRARDTDNLALVGSSVLNRADPPPIGDYVRFAFEGDDYPLSSAAKTMDGAAQTWTFNVSSEKAGIVTVQFPDLREVPDGYAVTLIDPATGTHQNLRSDPTYAVASVGAGIERTLQLEVDPQGVVAAELPTELQLNPAFPNPFAGSTTLSYSLPEASNVELTVYDMLGRRVATLVRDDMPAGNHMLVWDGRTDQGHDTAPGVYIARFQSADFTETIAMTRTR